MRDPPRTERLEQAAVRTLAVAVCVCALAWVLDLPRTLRWLVYTEQFLATMLALGLALTFLHYRASRRAGGCAPWFDWLAALLSLGVGGYVAVVYPSLVEQLAYAPRQGVAIAAVLLLLVLEGLRRTAGWVLTLIVVAFVVYAFFGHALPGLFAARELHVARALTQLMLDPSALLGTPLLVAATIVVAFVLFGTLLSACGGADFFTGLALALMGRYRGGAAKIAIVGSSLFGSISGSAVSNVATTGIVTIPLMKRGGFPPAMAAGIEAVASTGGQLMPPIMGASAFLLAEFLEIPYREVVLAALTPAILYYVALFLQADLRAARAGIERVPQDRIPTLRAALHHGWVFLVPFAVLILALFWWNVQPGTAAVYAAASVVALAYARRASLGRPGWRVIPGALVETGKSVVDILMITAAAGLIIGVLNISGLSFGLTLVLVRFGEANLAVLLLIAAVLSIVLGMGMPTVGVYVLLAALVAPALVKLGIEPIAAHLFVLYFGMMSMITPPVAIAAFAAATLSGAPPMRTCWEAMRFGWTAYIIPFLFVMSPSLIMQGSWGAFVLAACTAVAGVSLVTIGAVGYLVRPLGVPTRVAFVLSGAAMMIPAGAFAGAVLTDILGAMLGAAMVIREVHGARRSRADLAAP